MNSFFKNRIARIHIGQVLFVVFEKFSSAYLNQIAQEIILLLANNLHEKPITESQNG